MPVPEPQAPTVTPPQTTFTAHAAAHDSDGIHPKRAAGDGSGGGSPALRGEVLVHLREMGPLAPEQLAAHLGASRTGVLQVLRALESAGLVSRQTVRHGVGRPRHLYDVTPAAQPAFPSNYDALAAGLVAAIDAVGGPDLVASVFEARRRILADAVRERLDERVGPQASLFDRVRELAVMQDEQGYLAAAALDADGAVRLRECNCAIYGVAAGNTAACDAELALFRDVLGTEVVRETHIACGDRACTYRIGPAGGEIAEA
jgi:predicted ArsR family transcriptional regulator